MSNELPHPQWLTVDPAAAYVQQTSRWIMRARQEGRLPATKVGRKLYFRLSDLDALIESGGSVEPADKAS